MTYHNTRLMRPFEVVGIVFLCFFVASSAVAQKSPQAKAGEMSLEEKTVRLAYMKLELYNRAINIDQDRKRGVTHRNSDDLSFRVDVLKQGRINEILEVPFSALITKPGGETIAIGNVGTAEDDTVGYSARWSGGPNSIEDWDMPLRNVLRILDGGPPDMTYVNFEVEAALAGKSRRYRALTIFRPGFVEGDPAGTYFIDMITGVGGRMGQFLYERRTPFGANSGKRPVSKGIAGLSSTSTSADAAVSPISCNFETFKCCWLPGFKYQGYNYPACEGASSRGNEDGALGGNELFDPASGSKLAASCEPEPAGCRFARYEREKVTEGSDDSSHLWGQHGAKFRTTGFCQITPKCEVECGHDPTRVEQWETGLPSLSCHISFYSELPDPGKSVVNPKEPVKCSQSASLTWWACTLCLCGTPIPHIPWETRMLWKLDHVDDYTCGEQ